jgi:hypothetical protein
MDFNFLQPDDGAENEMPPLLDEALMETAVATLEETGRSLGLYLGEMMVAPPPMWIPQEDTAAHPVVMVAFAVGDYAFSDRVQNPNKVDQPPAKAASGSSKDAFLDRRARIQQAIAEGRDPFDDEEDGEEA